MLKKKLRLEILFLKRVLLKTIKRVSASLISRSSFICQERFKKICMT